MAILHCFWFKICNGLFKFSYFKIYIRTIKSDYHSCNIINRIQNLMKLSKSWWKIQYNPQCKWIQVLRVHRLNTVTSVYQIHLYSGNFLDIKWIIPILFRYTTPFYGVGKFFYSPDVKKLFTGESLLHFFYQFALSSTATTISSGTNLVVQSININLCF